MIKLHTWDKQDQRLLKCSSLMMHERPNTHTLCFIVTKKCIFDSTRTTTVGVSNIIGIRPTPCNTDYRSKHLCNSIILVMHPIAGWAGLRAICFDYPLLPAENRRDPHQCSPLVLTIAWIYPRAQCVLLFSMSSVRCCFLLKMMLSFHRFSKLESSIRTWLPSSKKCM